MSKRRWVGPVSSARGHRPTSVCRCPANIARPGPVVRVLANRYRRRVRPRAHSYIAAGCGCSPGRRVRRIAKADAVLRPVRLHSRTGLDLVDHHPAARRAWHRCAGTSRQSAQCHRANSRRRPKCGPPPAWPRRSPTRHTNRPTCCARAALNSRVAARVVHILRRPAHHARRQAAQARYRLQTHTPYRRHFGRDRRLLRHR